MKEKFVFTPYASVEKWLAAKKTLFDRRDFLAELPDSQRKAVLEHLAIIEGAIDGELIAQINSQMEDIE